MKTPAPREIVVEDLHRAFGGHAVLAGIDLTISRGELVAIVGGSGCGKTVLLKHMTAHFMPDRGRVLVADHETAGSPLRDLSGLSDDELDRIRVHWAVVYQKNALLTGSVYHNLAIWPREVLNLGDTAIRPRAERALRDVGLEPGEVMSSDRDSLSGGMAKRVAIARALVMDPVLVFYDEPTAGLDPEMCVQIHDLIGETHAARPGSLRHAGVDTDVSRTSVVVTHDTELLRRLRPRIVMLHAGRVRFDGSFDEFVESKDEHIRPYLAQMAFLHARLTGN